MGGRVLRWVGVQGLGPPRKGLLVQVMEGLPAPRQLDMEGSPFHGQLSANAELGRGSWRPTQEGTCPVLDSKLASTTPESKSGSA